MDAGMNDFYDYKRYAILYVDDEEKSLKYFTRAFGDHFRILTATNARDAFQMIEASGDDIGCRRRPAWSCSIKRGPFARA